MKNALYKELNTFMIRTPSFSVDKYFDFFGKHIEDKDIEEYVLKICKDPIFRESILIGSKNLYDSLIEFCNGKEMKKYDYFIQSIYKYLIRMSTRPTPFGLFSGIEFGKYTDGKTSITYKDNKFKKFARPDLEWIMKIVKEIEECSYSKLSFKINDSVFIKGQRAFLLHSTLQEGDNGVNEVSVRVTSPFETTYQLTQNSILYVDLKNELINKHKTADENQIDKYLKQLIENEYLISNIRPPLTVLDQFNYIINELKTNNLNDEILKKLIEIQQDIHSYTCTSLGNGENEYINLYKKMTHMAKTKNVLQIDMKSNLDYKNLNNIVIEDINQLMNMLSSIQTPYQKSDSFFSRYKQEYIEKYGQDREIYLLEMLDNDLGIGAPSDYNNPKNTKLETVSSISNITDDKVQNYFYNKYVESIKNNKSIKIIDKEINKLNLDKYNSNDLPNSLEINLIIKANSNEDIANNKFKYYIGPNLGSTSAGKSFGRFSYMMNEEKNLYKLIDDESLLLKDNEEYVTCEIAYLPNQVRNANVTRNIHGSNYEIALFTNSSKDNNHKIQLSDIVIGIENNVFYAKSKSLNKKLVITITNMLNAQSAPNAIRFLNDLTLDGTNIWYNFPWNNMWSHQPYIPKIEYRNFTISPETWILNELNLNISKNSDFEKFCKAFKNYSQKYNIPGYIYLTFADNRTLINTQDDKSLKILHHEFRNSYVDIVLNSYEDCGVNIIKDSNEKEYVCELIIPLIKVKQDKIVRLPTTKKLNTIPSISSLRVKPPFEDWLYLKIYGTSSNDDDLISYHFSEYCRDKIMKGKINKYFFMRYADPEQHIRLRLNGNEKNLIDIYPDLKRLLNSLIEKGLMTSYSIDSYDRELERYGGIKLMDIAEKLFYFDSIVVEEILKLKRSKSISFNNEAIGMISTIHYMKDFGLNHESQINFLRLQVSNSDYRKEFKENRSEYIEICNTNNDWQELRKTEEGNLLLNALSQRSGVVREYSDEIKNGLEVSTDLSILDSVIHLHCNRLFGINRELETKIRALASHSLYALNYFSS